MDLSTCELIIIGFLAAIIIFALCKKFRSFISDRIFETILGFVVKMALILFTAILVNKFIDVVDRNADKMATDTRECEKVTQDEKCVTCDSIKYK